VAAPEAPAPNPLEAPLAAVTAERDELQQALERVTSEREKLERQFAALNAERDKLKDQLVRAAADFENFRRRSRTELDEAKQRSKGDAVLELLPVFDNLERAVNAAKNAKDIASVIEGVRMVLKLFDDTAERMGLQRVNTLGERFDPTLHDAIQQVESAEQPAGTILSEVAAGYRHGKRLLRAAMVVVARPPAAPKPAPAAPTDAKADAAASPAADAPGVAGSGEAAASTPAVTPNQAAPESATAASPAGASDAASAPASASTSPSASATPAAPDSTPGTGEPLTEAE
jgi:molecular chaperone GrpE